MIDLSRVAALAAQGQRLAGRVPASGRWYDIKSSNSDGRTPIYIYGEIGGWWGEGVSAADFVRDLRAVSTPVDAHINSGGGSVFDGLAIYAALKNHEHGVDVYVDSLAASAASFIAMAGEQIVMEKPAKMMIHDASGLMLGNAADMRQMADLLDEMSDTIGQIYADRAGGDVTDWRTAMKSETWYSAQQAVDAGLADQIAGAPEAAPTATHKASQLIRARHRVRTKRSTR